MDELANNDDSGTSQQPFNSTQLSRILIVSVFTEWTIKEATAFLSNNDAKYLQYKV